MQENKNPLGCDIGRVLNRYSTLGISLLILLALIVPVHAESLDIVGEGGIQDVEIRESSIIEKTIYNFDYQKQNRLYINLYSNDFSKKDAFRFGYKGTQVSFSPNGMYLNSEKENLTKTQYKSSRIEGENIEYDELFGQNTRYTISDEGNIVKEELILLVNPYPAISGNDVVYIRYDFDYNGLTPYINNIVWDSNTQTITSDKMVFKNGNVEYFAFSSPIAYDSSGEIKQLSYKFSKNEILIQVPGSYLQSAKYPLTIDPSLEQNGGSITLDGIYNYDYVNLTNSAVLYISAYNGTGTTGTLILNTTYDVNIDATSSINGNERGYTGGSGGGVGGGGGGGSGAGGGSSGTAGTGTLGSGGGGGGNYATSADSGGNGGANSGEGSAGGSGGSTYGTSSGWDISMGSGAGGGGGASPCSSGGSGDGGGAGGAALTINSKRDIIISGTLTFIGGSGGAGGSCYTSSANGGGGGAGGSGGGILLNGSIINLNSATITTASGGGGGLGYGVTEARNGHVGGSGGMGRFKVFYRGSFSNTSTTLTTGTAYYLNTNAVPTVPVLTTHAAYHNSGSTTVSWSASTDGDGDPITYDVKVGTTSGGTDILNYAGDTDTTSNSFTATIPNTYYWSVRACDIYACSTWATESSFAWGNSAPTTPTLTNPTNNSVAYDVTTLNMTWTTSTDADSDTITYYYFVSNNSGFSELMVQGMTNNTWSGDVTISASSQHFLKVIANDTHTNVTSSIVSIRDLSLTSPVNNSNIYFTYPPSTTPVTFVWNVSNSSVINYNLVVARDSTFTLIVSNTTFFGSEKALSLEEDVYYWKVRPYYTETGIYGAYTSAWIVNVSINATGEYGTAIQGVVYELINGVITPVNEASVYIQHSAGNWSSQMTTGSNGYYLFQGLQNSTIYYVYASKQDYQNSATEYITTGLGIVVTRNILLKPTEPTDFESDKQYVKIKVRWLWCFSDCDISGATVSAYKSNDLIAYASGITDTTGSVSLRLYKTQLYRITAVKSTAGINQEMTLYPKDSEYVFLITNTAPNLQEHTIQEKDAITISVSKAILNTTHATITLNYSDTLNETTGLTYYINQSNSTMLQSWIWTSGSYNHTFTLSGYSGQSYMVHVVATHDEYGTIDRSYSVPFEKTSVGIPGISNTLWLWFAVAVMFFTAAMFTESTAEKGLLIVCAEGWIFFFMGMFSSLDSAQFTVSLTLATVIGVFAYIKRSQATEGYT